MSTIVLTAPVKEKGNFDNVVRLDKTHKRKKSSLSDSFEKIDLQVKSPKNKVGNNIKLELSIKIDNLKENCFDFNKYNLDFEYNSLSFLRIKSDIVFNKDRSNKIVTLQLNMCFDIYNFIKDLLLYFVKDLKIDSVKKIKVELMKSIKNKIVYWKIEKKKANGDWDDKMWNEDFVNEKCKFLIGEFFRFKKQLQIHIKS